MVDVKVEILNMATSVYLEELIKKYLTDGYLIQNSQVQWYQGTIEGVYVFVKE